MADCTAPFCANRAVERDRCHVHRRDRPQITNLPAAPEPRRPPPAPRPVPSPRPSPEETEVPDPLIENVLRHDDPKVRKAAVRARDAVDALRDTYAAYEKRRAAREEVDRLEKELAAARERLGGPKPAPSIDSKTIRAWAAANGVECTRTGRVPATVVDAWRAATAAESAAR